eukprot:CAMPEP_0170749800 /NCGR_PEP_ID=MMETSP0437-20130122/10588_1 /TAXON_ID=0 /ORGANISM="Sexangularia sp." /LENGTH=205 /DNA_ID=CAMNT_0011088747 /DNA_START=58 /DNA_END=675 /DNA_ORIENTATION=+
MTLLSIVLLALFTAPALGDVNYIYFDYQLCIVKNTLNRTDDVAEFQAELDKCLERFGDDSTYRDVEVRSVGKISADLPGIVGAIPAGEIQGDTADLSWAAGTDQVCIEWVAAARSCCDTGKKECDVRKEQSYECYRQQDMCKKTPDGVIATTVIKEYCDPRDGQLFAPDTYVMMWRAECTASALSSPLLTVAAALLAATFCSSTY